MAKLRWLIERKYNVREWLHDNYPPGHNTHIKRLIEYKGGEFFEWLQPIDQTIKEQIMYIRKKFGEPIYYTYIVKGNKIKKVKI